MRSKWHIVAKYTPVLACAAVFLVACTEPLVGEYYDVKQAHPIEVSSRIKAHAVDVDHSAPSPAGDKDAELTAFVREFIQYGGDTLEVAVAGESLEGTDADAVTEDIVTRLLLLGVRRDEIRIKRVKSQAANGPAVLSFERYRAEFGECGRQVRGGGYVPRNTKNIDFGCAHRANMAAMASNPADLDRPRREQPTDAMRRSMMIERYRSGESTETERGEREDAGSIRELVEQ